MITKAHRKFKRLLKERKMRQCQVAKELGVSEGTISFIMNGVFTPGRVLSVKIEQWSLGHMRVEDWE